MDTKLVANQYKLQQWAAVIQDCRSSEMMIKDWCEQNNITRDRYYYWQRKVREAACESLTKQDPDSQSFAEIPTVLTRATITDPFHAELTILVADSVISVNRSTDPLLLKTVIEVLKDAQ